MIKIHPQSSSKKINGKIGFDCKIVDIPDKELYVAKKSETIGSALPESHYYAKLNENTSQDKIFSEITGEMRKKIIAAYLPIIIMTRINETSITTAPDISSVLKLRYAIKLSPGTIYPTLYKLEREGNIERLLKRIKKTYILTSKGKKISVYMHESQIMATFPYILATKVDKTADFPKEKS